jgi:anaerobic selenocysteine-containing dehydrogenase
MGFPEPCFHDSVDELIEQALNAPAMEGITRQELEAKRSIRLQSAGNGVLLPFAKGIFATPSGKAEFYSSALAAEGLEPLPAFHPPDESRRGADAHTFPLEFLPRKANHYMNSTFANLPGHQKMESPGLVFMHASDAAAREIGEAELVEIYNARGKIQLRARIDGSVPAGVVAASLNWNKLSEGGNNVNALTSERLTDLGRGATFYSTLVEVRKLAPTKNLFPPID